MTLSPVEQPGFPHTSDYQSHLLPLSIVPAACPTPTAGNLLLLEPTRCGCNKSLCNHVPIKPSRGTRPKGLLQARHRRKRPTEVRDEGAWAAETRLDPADGEIRLRILRSRGHAHDLQRVRVRALR